MCTFINDTYNNNVNESLKHTVHEDTEFSKFRKCNKIL